MFIVGAFIKAEEPRGIRRAFPPRFLVRSVTDDNNSARRRDESNCRKEGPDTAQRVREEGDEEDVEREMAGTPAADGTSETTHN